VAPRVTRSPRAVIGDSASKADAGDVAPVPPALTGRGELNSLAASSRIAFCLTLLMGVFDTA
jgi:hypothetical protein